MTGKVVHCKRSKFDLYIGRNDDPAKGLFGNPFTHKDGTKAQIKVATQKQAVEYFRNYMNDGGGR